MNKIPERFLYRVVCVLSLLGIIYLIVDMKLSGTLDYKLIVAFAVIIFIIIWGIRDWNYHYHIMKRQEEELKLYHLYVQPLEELVKSIRIRQHEYDNHTNAILNMHLTIDNYEELIGAQSAYIKEAVKMEERKYLTLLKISDKVLAGFLYSKLIKRSKFIETEVYVQKLEIISGVSESHLIEIIGTLVDNAYEACDKRNNHVNIYVDSEDDHLIFEIQNEHPPLKMREIARFFEKGYSTKISDGSRGYGLYQAKKMTEQFGGEITVSTLEIDDRNYISFKVVI